MPYNQFSGLGQSFLISQIVMNKGFFSGIRQQCLTPAAIQLFGGPEAADETLEERREFAVLFLAHKRPKYLTIDGFACLSVYHPRECRGQSLSHAFRGILFSSALYSIGIEGSTDTTHKSSLVIVDIGQPSRIFCRPISAVYI